MYWLGVVRDIFDDNSIKFDIDGLDSFTEKPVAIPAESTSIKPVIGDRVLINQLNDRVQTFVYHSFSKEFVGIKNDDAYIDITDKGNCVIKFPNYSLETSKADVTITLGNVKLKANESGIEIGGSGVLKIKGIPGVKSGSGPFIASDAQFGPNGTPMALMATDTIILGG